MVFGDAPENMSSREGVVVAAAKEFFLETYAANASIIAAAPGRVNIIGEHTDYQGGFVCPMAVTNYCVVAADWKILRGGKVGVVKLASRDFNASPASTAVTQFTLKSPLRPVPSNCPESWQNYVSGVFHQYSAFLTKLPVLSVEIAIVSTVPRGCGLSSSAALEVATARVLEEVIRKAMDCCGDPSISATWKEDLRRLDSYTIAKAITAEAENSEADYVKQVLEKINKSGDLNKVATALRCQKAEHEFGGVACGIMDQYISSAAREGNALLIDCKNLTSTLVPFPAGLSAVITKTNVKHSLSDGAYNMRVKDCNEALLIFNEWTSGAKISCLRDVDNVQQLVDAYKRKFSCDEDGLESIVSFRRARHVVSENKRVIAFLKAMASRNYLAAGEYMYQSHESLRDDFEVSCPELDELVNIARGLSSSGVVGARMTGGGFGGCTITLVKTEQAENIRHLIETHYASKFPHLAADGDLTLLSAAGCGAWAESKPSSDHAASRLANMCIFGVAYLAIAATVLWRGNAD